MAVLNILLARKAERDRPAEGKFLEARGGRLHYLDIIPGTGHMVHHAAPERVAAAIHLATQKYG